MKNERSTQQHITREQALLDMELDDLPGSFVEKKRAQYAHDILMALMGGAGEHIVTQTNEETGPMFAKWSSRLAWAIADNFVEELVRRAQRLADEHQKTE